jgi:hypothetical protein
MYFSTLARYESHSGMPELALPLGAGALGAAAEGSAALGALGAAAVGSAAGVSSFLLHALEASAEASMRTQRSESCRFMEDPPGSGNTGPIYALLAAISGVSRVICRYGRGVPMLGYSI